jgi:hypothetical protein
MDNYYNTPGNASMHPFRFAYDKFEQDKKDVIGLLKMSKPAWDNYNLQMARYNRLVVEQNELLKLMKDDLTSDLLVEKLQA